MDQVDIANVEMKDVDLYPEIRSSANLKKCFMLIPMTIFGAIQFAGVDRIATVVASACLSREEQNSARTGIK